MRVVEDKWAEIAVLAEKLNLSLRSFTSAYRGESPVTRVCLYTGGEPVSYKSESVIKVWEFKGLGKAGKTEKCKRYRIYSEVEAYLGGLKHSTLEQLHVSLSQHGGGKDRATFRLIKELNRDLIENMDVQTRNAFFESVHA